MNAFDQYEVWFVTGAQLLYGGDAVIAVDAHSNEMVNGLNESGKLPVKVVYKGTANSSKEVETVFKAANNDEKCIGVITWMHTFSPAKMWIHGLQQLKKPLMHLHTQFNKEIPWDTMDMDFMNLNQSAHGDREFGHICTRMRIRRKVVVGYWKDENTLHKIAVWMRVCAGWADSQDMLIIRFGDQMNNVAVTDGDKVEAEQRMGYHVDYCPVSELMEYHKEIKAADVDALVATYFKEYDHESSLEDKSTEAYQKVWNAAKAELALRAILKAKGAKGFTTNFDDLGDLEHNGFDQIPGLASQRLMAEGYGFGAEGDWKSAALYRTVWVMNQGLPKGCSFLEDYTLNFDGAQSSILQSHMLEVCPLIAANRPRLEVHFLGIGIRKSQTARKNLRAAKDSLDLGVTICYNSVSDIKYIKPVISVPSAMCINPVNWKTDATPATLHDTITVTLSPEHNVLVLSGYSGSEYTPILGIINTGDFHGAEPWLYSECLAKNIQQRIKAYRKLYP